MKKRGDSVRLLIPVGLTLVLLLGEMQIPVNRGVHILLEMGIVTGTYWLFWRIILAEESRGRVRQDGLNPVQRRYLSAVRSHFNPGRYERGK